MNFPKFHKIGRSAVCIIVLVAIFAVYEFRLVEWQIVRGDEFHALAMSNKTDSIELPGARGEILDKNGVILSGNRTSYDIVYNALKMVYEERNATIVKIVALLEKHGEKWRDVLPIEVDKDGNYAFSADKESAIATLKETFTLAEYATADDCMKALTDQYDCSGYSKEDTRIVASVRYSMTRDGYSRTNPYVIAKGVSPETVGIISEREEEFKGIEPQVSVSRYYGEEGNLAPHIVGNIGDLSEDQYNAAIENKTAYDSEGNPSGYKWTDTRGQTGIENAFETQLRGKRGHENIIVDERGTVQSTTVTEPPEEGNSVRLTLDADLQRVANLSLEENVKANVLAEDCTAGAAVVIDPKTFGVLASASYPSFDMNLYKNDDAYLNKVTKDKTQPLYNRALEGAYTPGSVFKPMVALAALQENVISAASAPVNCQGMFEFYDLNLKCTGTHGNANVYQAISGSCNAFFCQIGLDLTIKKMDAYAEYFALGTKTGIELPESVGIMSGPQEYSENHPGFTWTDGLTAQTAIGQCDNTFTPIQLATYCATIANGGVRLNTHFMDKVTDYTGKNIIEEYVTKQVSDAGLSSDVLGVVSEGMRQVAASPEGTAYATFGDYPIGIAAKTGTAEVSENGDQPNLTFIAYAPIDNPQIAVAVVMEKGWKGAYAQQVAKDIFDQYFGFVTRDKDGNRYNSDGDMIDKTGTVLKTKAEVDADKEKVKASPSPSGKPSGTGLPGANASPSPSRPPERGDEIPSAPFIGDNSPPPTASASPKVTAKPNSPYWRDDSVGVNSAGSSSSGNDSSVDGT